MKKFALVLLAALCITSLLFVAACDDDDDDKASCSQDAVTDCTEASTQCGTDAATASDPVTAAEACMADLCTCLEDAGCADEANAACGE